MDIVTVPSGKKFEVYNNPKSMDISICLGGVYSAEDIIALADHLDRRKEKPEPIRKESEK